MDRVQKMQEQGSSYSVKFTEMTRIYSKDQSTLICIFEGKDEKYYANSLNNIKGQGRWSGINTGGRSAVLKLIATIDQHSTYNKVNYAGFIDRDYEDWFVNPNPNKIYVTPCYSIENLYVTEKCFIQILSAEFYITEFNENRDEFPKCLDAFRNRLDDFVNGVEVFNIWAKAHRIMKRDDPATKGLNVGNVDTKDIVKTDINCCVIAYDPSDPSSIFKDSSGFSFSTNALTEAANSFKNIDKARFFRGKQQIDFICELLLEMKKDRNSKSPKFFSKKGKVSISISKDNAISELSQYADIPDCLKAFIRAC